MSSSHDIAVVADGHVDEETTCVSVGSENCMEMRRSPVRFIDTSDSCILCGHPLGNEAQVRLQCGHHYHLHCWTKQMRDSCECVKCNPEKYLSIPSPVVESTTIYDQMLQQFAWRAYTLLQSDRVCTQVKEE